MPTADGDLARAIAAGSAPDEEAELCRRFAPRVRAMGLRHLRDASRAADLAQEVMARVIVKLREGAVRDPDRLGAFVLGTARAVLHEGFRAERRAGAAGERLSHEAERAVAAVDPLDLEALRRCLHALGERERTVIVFTFWNDEDGPEIARRLGTSPGNVRVMRHRAIATLSRCLEGAA